MDAPAFLYKTAAGRLLLKPLVRRGVSRLAGRLLDLPASKLLIGGFVRRTGIDTREYDLSDIRCFNDFFCRPIKPGMRPVDEDPAALIAPCDALLTAVPVRSGTVLNVKQSRWSVARLLGDPELAGEFEDGWCLVFRLCVGHFHRYCYFDSGEKGENVFIPGKLHTVRPVALEGIPVFTENCREYVRIDSDGFGLAVQAEVGAMLVGHIVNNEPGPGHVRRGEEKGRFEYGGSTILLLLRKDAAELRGDILRASAVGTETPVRLGERIGVRAGRASPLSGSGDAGQKA